MKKRLSFIALFLFCQLFCVLGWIGLDDMELQAQEIRVVDCRILPNDNSAEIDAVQDNNGNLCGLVKVVTNGIEGLHFPNKNEYIGEPVYKKDEKTYFIHVPEMLSKISFTHDDYMPGEINLKDYGYKVKSGKVYLVNLVASSASRNERMITFRFNPVVEGILSYDSQNIPIPQDGIIEVEHDKTAFRYVVSADNYESLSGMISEGTAAVARNIVMQPMTVEVNVSCNVSSAHVFVDDVDYGSVGTMNIPLGKHRIRISCKGFVDQEREEVITKETNALSFILSKNKGKQIDIHPTPVVIFAKGITLYKNNKEIEEWKDGATVYFMPDKKYLLTIDDGPNNFVRVGWKPMVIHFNSLGKIESVTENEPKVNNNLTNQETSENRTTLGEYVDNISLMKEIKHSDEMSKTKSQSTSKSLDVLSFTANGVTFEMVKVEAGSFMMGATSEMQKPYSDEKPTHEVTLTNNYYLGKTEVSQALWKAVMGSSPSGFDGDEKPVEQVSWNDCLEFISKLNSATGKNFRLPTEAEWEFAARGGNKSCHYQYGGGNDLDETVWYEDNGGDSTHNVATKRPNELGLYDMSGNVLEWCFDWYGIYNGSSQKNPTGPNSGTDHVARGGSFYVDARHCRSSQRMFCPPDCRRYDLGFRLALTE